MSVGRWAIPACGLLVLACGEQRLLVDYEIPPPRAGTPYGYLAVEVDPGETRNAKLIVKGTAMVTRAAEVPGEGVVVVRLPKGKWEIQVTGNPGEGDVIKFGGAKPADAPVAGRGPQWFPKKPIVVRVEKNRMTNAGRICAHAGCKSFWSAAEPPGLEAWAAANRLVIIDDPPEETVRNPNAPETGSK